MAKIIYALSGQGRGHSSRVTAISAALRDRGHTVVHCCGGTAREVLESHGEEVIPVPHLGQVVERNKLKIGRTLLLNTHNIVYQNRIVDDLAERLGTIGADLVITDFEAFAPKAADKLGIPVLSFNHQEIVTRTDYEIPSQCRLQARFTSMAIKLIAPNNPVHTLLSSFFYPPLRDPDSTTLIGPIIRPAVQNLKTSVKDHVLVYFNQPVDSEYILHEFAACDHRFIVYNFPESVTSRQFRNITFKTPSIDGFLADLASCKAIICTAGFTLISEALYIGKPILVLPNKGIFEQTLNAYFLKISGLGDALLDDRPDCSRISHFLKTACVPENYRPRIDCGNENAISCIESVIDKHCPSTSSELGNKRLQTASA